MSSYILEPPLSAPSLNNHCPLCQTLGITIGGIILQNDLKAKLPPALFSEVGGGIEIAYALIPRISTLPERLRTQVREAFASDFRTIWLVCVGLAGIGLAATCLVRAVPLRRVTDENWGCYK